MSLRKKLKTKKKSKKLNKTEQTEKYGVSEIEILTFLGESFEESQVLQFHL